jgi:hypothetical protein
MVGVGMPRKTRKYGTRATGGLLLYGSEQLASIVIGAYRSGARANAPNWSRDYLAGINAYITSEERTRAAQRKLAAWYQALAEMAPEIRRVYGDIKARYAQILGTLIVTPRTPAPAAPARPTQVPTV